MTEQLSHYYYNEGLKLARRARLTGAIHNLTRAISYDRANIPAWNLAGLCYYRTGKFRTAGYCWAHSVNRCPENNRASHYLAVLKEALQETEPSFERLSALCAEQRYLSAAALLSQEIMPRFGPAEELLTMLGLLKMLAGRQAAAVKCWEEALTINVNSANALRYLEAAEQAGRFQFGALKARLFNLLKG